MRSPFLPHHSQPSQHRRRLPLEATRSVCDIEATR